MGLGLCQKRVWEVIRYSHDGETELVPLVHALEHHSQLRHEGHEVCTKEKCEHAHRDYTSVQQLHKCPNSKKCVATTDNMFNQSRLVEALNGSTMTTAWTLNGMSLLAQDRSFLAVSHVWSDGTGNGSWEPGKVNKCLWDFWVKIARDLRCNGVWWDTICIPRNDTTRAQALNKMHRNYAHAKCTVVHDLYLAGIEWRDDGSPCIALVLSPWFSRAWTALELLLSKRVFILFRKGDGYTLKDLDKEVLAQHQFLDSHAHWIATHAVERLRDPDKTLTHNKEILSVLHARQTSRDTDRSIIAGLMCGLTEHAALSEEDITKQILLELGNIDQRCLFHGQPTMSEPQFSWCPPRFLDLPAGGNSNQMQVRPNGTVYGLWEIWYIPSKLNVDKSVVQPSKVEAGMYKVRQALQHPEHCVILKSVQFDFKGLLVRLKDYKEADKVSRKKHYMHCEYIGLVDVNPSEVRQHGDPLLVNVVIGYEPEMVNVRAVDWKPKG